MQDECVSDFANRIVVICEAPADVRVAKGFAERVLTENLEWLRDVPEALPKWCGLQLHEGLLAWKNVTREYEFAALPLIRKAKDFENFQPPDPDAIATLKALRLAERVAPLAVVLTRDMDHQPERKDGLQQGLNVFKEQNPKEMKSLPVVIGWQDRYREAWLLAAFVAKSAIEEERLQNEQKDLQKAVVGLNLQKEPHRLRGAPGQPRCAKDIWEHLSNNDFTREDACWNDVPFEILHANGLGCGLSAYLLEVEKHLLPAVRSGQS
jgi:hypothetical protein